MSKLNTETGEHSGGAHCSPVRVTLSRRKGWRMPPNTVKVCRPGFWGNPFRVGDWRPDGEGFIRDQAEAVELFQTHEWAAEIRSRANELRGKNLACWCKQGTPCHADVLLDLANVASELSPERSGGD
jgi:hypothetical protein